MDNKVSGWGGWEREGLAGRQTLAFGFGASVNFADFADVPGVPDAPPQNVSGVLVVLPKKRQMVLFFASGWPSVTIRQYIRTAHRKRRGASGVAV